MIAYSELPDGAYYVVPNEMKRRLRQKGGKHPGCALRGTLSWWLGLFLATDPTDRNHDASMQVMRVYL